MTEGVLVVAATPGELAWVAGRVPVLVCGVGPVEAAARTAAALAASRPGVVLNVGVAGGAPPLTAVIGARALYADVRAGIPVERVADPDPGLVALARSALPGAPVLDIATTAAVGSTRGPVEAMEGFGVLRACALAGVPAVEVRVISNAIGEPDRGAWDVEGALAVLAAAGARLLDQLRA